MKDYEKRFADRMKAIRESANALSNTASRFGSSVKNAWGTMDKAASEYGMRLTHTIQETTEELARANPSPKFPEAEKVHEDSVRALNKIIVTTRKYMPKLHRGLKTEMAALNTALARLEISVRSLGDALDDSPGAKMESLRRDVEILARRQDSLTALRGEEKECKAQLESLLERQKGFLQQQAEVTSQGEFLELKRFRDEARLKEDEIRQVLQHVAKPLVKLERMMSDRQSPPVDMATLRGLIKSPVETIATAQAFSITRILEQLDEALSSGQVDVEERKKRKAQDAIQNVKIGALDDVRQQYVAIQANIQETLRQLRANGLLEKNDKIEALLGDIRKDKAALSAREREVERRIGELSNEILKQKTSLEAELSKLARKTITIHAADPLHPSHAVPTVEHRYSQ
jgi:hypothetical protein